MRTLCTMAAAVGVLALLAGPVAAQGRFGGGNLLTNASVQKELKLSDEQIEKAKKAGEDLRAKYKDDFAKIRDMKEDERRELFKKMAADGDKAATDILKPEQLKRYKQITLQQRGLADEDAQKALKVTDEQKSKLKKIGEDLSKELRTLRENSKGDFKTMLEKSTELRKKATTDSQAVLTDEQKKAWKEMTGEPFEIKFERRRTNDT